MTTFVETLTSESVGRDCCFRNNANDNGNAIYVGNPASGSYRHNGLIMWPLTEMPLAATVINAYISLYNVYNNSNGPCYFIANRSKRAWVETQATYYSYASGGDWQVQWSRGDLDIDTTYLAISPAIAGNSLPVGTEVQFTFTEYGKTELKKMYDGTYTNNGFHFQQLGAEDSGHAFMHGFGSSANATAGYRPKITIEYYLPGGGLIIWTSQFRKWSEKKRRLMDKLINQNGRLVGAQI